jgi:hypothetical protein
MRGYYGEDLLLRRSKPKLKDVLCRVACPSLFSTFAATFHGVHAIAEALNRRVRALVRSCGFYGGQSGTGAGFLWVLRFPLQIFIPPTAPHSSPSNTQGWCDRPVNRRTKRTQCHYPPYLEVFSTRNPRTRHAAVTRDQLKTARYRKS